MVGYEFLLKTLIMYDKLRQRLQVLKAEYESGQKVMAELEVKQASVRDTLLRISGAIQVLEEELADVETETSSPTTPAKEDPIELVAEPDMS